MDMYIAVRAADGTLLEWLSLRGTSLVEAWFAASNGMASGGNITDDLIELEMKHRAAVWNINRAERLGLLISYGMFNLQLLCDINRREDEVQRAYERALAAHQRSGRGGKGAASSSAQARAGSTSVGAGHPSASGAAVPSTSCNPAQGGGRDSVASGSASQPAAGTQALVSRSYPRVVDVNDLPSSPAGGDEKHWWAWQSSHLLHQGATTKDLPAKQRRQAGMAAADLQRQRQSHVAEQQVLQPPPVVDHLPAAWGRLNPGQTSQEVEVRALADMVHESFLAAMPAGGALEEDVCEEEEEQEPSAEDCEAAAALVAMQEAQCSAGVCVSAPSAGVQPSTSTAPLLPSTTPPGPAAGSKVPGRGKAAQATHSKPAKTSKGATAEKMTTQHQVSSSYASMANAGRPAVASGW
jgi:hypothetical protein